MKGDFSKHEKEMIRARKALGAAKILLSTHLYEDAVSRAYYSVLHAAKAALCKIGVEPESHRAVRAMFSLHLVKTGKIEKEFATILTAEYEDREMGDYDIDIDIESERAEKRVQDAEAFIVRVEQFLK
jgi:uncharacterized protein (UPF0332 family)